MPVRYGIVCDWCRKFLLIPEERKSGRIHYDRSERGFTARCIPPCPNIVFFHRGMLVAYVVPDEAIQSGYADLDDCRPVAKTG